MREQIYVGMDIHRKFSFVSVVNQEGQEMKKYRLEHDDMDTFREFFGNYEGASVAMEATCGWMWLADELEQLGLDVHLAHSSGVKSIANSHKKTDKEDAKILANLLRTNYLPEAYLAPPEVRDNREILRYRTALVKVRTMAKNRVHSQLIKLNLKPETTDTFNKKGRECIEHYKLPETHREIVDGWLALIDFLDVQIGGIEKQIKSRLIKDPRAELLQTLRGIGFLTAYTIISEVGYISRFQDENHFCSYCGLVPLTRQSADKVFQGRIIPGRVTLKWNIVEATHIAIRCDSYFSKLFHKHCKTKGNGKAVIICAHKMAKIIYRMLKEERPYRSETINGENKVGSIAPMTN